MWLEHKSNRQGLVGILGGDSESGWVENVVCDGGGGIYTYHHTITQTTPSSPRKFTSPPSPLSNRV